MKRGEWVLAIAEEDGQQKGAEAFAVHGRLSPGAAFERAVEAAMASGYEDPEDDATTAFVDAFLAEISQ